MPVSAHAKHAACIEQDARGQREPARQNAYVALTEWRLGDAVDGDA